ncbi:hypothetical protein B6D52_02920 [Candidatus Parcubacteria bacterium 4484_255]|nr:MAG: hypothetical protein B6D52_02920 [Candidatus Parcubacteria bacterium 4484_255]
MKTIKGLKIQQDKKNIVDVKKDKKNIVDVKKDKKNIVDVKKDKKKKGKEERASEDFTVSLMPRQTIIISRVVHSRLLFLMAAVIIILGLFFVSRLYGNWYFDNLEARAEYLKREIALLEIQTVPFLEDRDEIAFLANKAIKAKKALNNHVYWTNFFNLLESYTVPGVYFGDFNARARETIRLSATGRDLISLAQQIVAFDNAPDFIKDVDVSNIQKSDAGVSAFFDLTLIDSVWQK